MYQDPSIQIPPLSSSRLVILLAPHLHPLVIISPDSKSHLRFTRPPSRRRVLRADDGGGCRGRRRGGGGEGARALPRRPPPGGAGALLRRAGCGAGPRAAHRAPQQPRRLLPKAPRLPQGPTPGSLRSGWVWVAFLHRLRRRFWSPPRLGGDFGEGAFLRRFQVSVLVEIQLSCSGFRGSCDFGLVDCVFCSSYNNMHAQFGLGICVHGLVLLCPGSTNLLSSFCLLW